MRWEPCLTIHFDITASLHHVNGSLIRQNCEMYSFENEVCGILKRMWWVREHCRSEMSYENIPSNFTPFNCWWNNHNVQRPIHIHDIVFVSFYLLSGGTLCRRTQTIFAVHSESSCRFRRVINHCVVFLPLGHLPYKKRQYLSIHRLFQHQSPSHTKRSQRRSQSSAVASPRITLIVQTGLSIILRWWIKTRSLWLKVKTISGLFRYELVLLLLRILYRSDATSSKNRYSATLWRKRWWCGHRNGQRTVDPSVHRRNYYKHCLVLFTEITLSYYYFAFSDLGPLAIYLRNAINGSSWPPFQWEDAEGCGDNCVLLTSLWIWMDLDTQP